MRPELLRQELQQSRLRAISLFTGAGGLDIGFEAAGFQTIACVERNADARETLRRNRPDWNLLAEGDVFRASVRDLMSVAGVSPGEIDLVLGGPPCQPFSKSAYWLPGGTRRLSDPRAETLGAMLEVVERSLPRALVIENVRGIGYREKNEGVLLVRHCLRRINRLYGTRYRPAIAYLKATAYGVPQIRERAFIVAFRDGQRFEAPLPIRGVVAATEEDGLSPIATTWDAIGDITPSARELPELALKGKWAALIPSIPEGHNYLFHTSRGRGLPLFGWRTRFWSFLLKLAKDQPSWTLQACPGPATGPFHWENRLIWVREMCRLQTIPDEYEIVGDYASARRQIGNAVPPAMAEGVARRIRSMLLGEKYHRDLSLATPPRSDRPEPETPSKVPPEYLTLVGDHLNHPGTGNGPGSRRREVAMPAAALAAVWGPDDGCEDSDANALDLRLEERSAA